MRINDGVTVTQHAQLQDPPLTQLKVIRLINNGSFTPLVSLNSGDVPPAAVI